MGEKKSFVTSSPFYVNGSRCRLIYGSLYIPLYVRSAQHFENVCSLLLSLRFSTGLGVKKVETETLMIYGTFQEKSIVGRFHYFVFRRASNEPIEFMCFDEVTILFLDYKFMNVQRLSVKDFV